MFELEMNKTAAPGRGHYAHGGWGTGGFSDCSFGFRICFGFRVSDFD